MILFILLQLLPIGLTGQFHSDPLYNLAGPRNIVILKRITPVDSTYVKKDTVKLVRPIKIKVK